MERHLGSSSLSTGQIVLSIVPRVPFRPNFSDATKVHYPLDIADSIDREQPMAIAQVFIYLQLLDLLTTLVGFKLGAREASPFIRMLMHAGPAAGVLASKFLALGPGAVCLYYKKNH